MASNKFGVPGELETEALSEALESARTKAQELAKVDDDQFTDEQFEELESAVEFTKEASAELESREKAAQERAEKLASLKQEAAPKDEEEEEEPAPEDEAPSDEETPPEEEDEEEDEEKKAPFSTEESAPEGEVETAGSDATEQAAEDEVETAADDEQEDIEEEADVPQNGKASLSDASKHAPKSQPVAEGTKVSLTAAANVPNVQPGKEFESVSEASGVVEQALSALPRGGQGRTRNNALRFSVDNEFKQSTNTDDLQVMLEAANEHRLDGGSLVAAGGWAAPSEDLLDFCSIEQADGLIDLPSITLNRPGINYTKGPDFQSVLGSTSGFWDMDEATAEAGSEQKTSLRPQDPTFTEIRADAIGVMVEAGLLTRAGWPELVNRYVSLATLAHQFKVHQKTIADIEAFTGAATSVPNGFGNALDVLHGIDVVAAGERQRFAMGVNGTLEALLPHWVKNVIRADLANRAGVDLLEITDARINAFFSARNIRVQWLNHWQNLDVDTNGVSISYPDTVEIILYPAGTYVRGEKDVVTLDTVYDSVNLKSNDYVALFMEQGILTANPCYEGRRISIPLNANGRTGAADITSNLFAAA